jgi:hypothetical protein
MKNSRLLTAIAALAALGACATATPYQAAHDGARGYTNQQIENDRWQVSFAGNSLTDRQTVETYLLYRAAELTDQNGFDHFRVVQRETEANRNVVPTGFGAYDPFYSGYQDAYMASHAATLPLHVLGSAARLDIMTHSGADTTIVKLFAMKRHLRSLWAKAPSQMTRNISMQTRSL